MNFDKTLLEARLIRRYKRFLADVELPSGARVTAHTPNTGSMRGCCNPGARVWLLDTENPARKYPLSWELVEAAGGVIVGINTGIANTLVREGITNGSISELQDYQSIRTEVAYGNEKSRIDLLLEDDLRGKCYVEVKNVTMAENHTGYFPDAVSLRGTRHLRELAAMAGNGHRAVIFFCIQRSDVTELRPADMIDPLYGTTLRQVLDEGVEALAYQADVSPAGIKLARKISVNVNAT